jgi:predicted ATP-binding protein involved in virulence
VAAAATVHRRRCAPGRQASYTRERWRRTIAAARMRIDQIILKDVGPFQDATIDLPPGQDPKLADVYLLTGPNGCGKSTVLYALAAMLGGFKPELGPELLSRRLRGKDAFVELLAGAKRRLAGFRLPDRAEPLQVVHAGSSYGVFVSSNQVLGGPSEADYSHLAGTPDLWRSNRFNWAAFCYAGKRSLDRGAVQQVQDVTTSPFAQSLSFLDSPRTGELASWIVNQQFKQLRAQNSGRTDRAGQLGRAIAAAERLVGQIIDDRGFGFITNDEDLDVRVRWNGEVVDLDLLPDGLKSITSWVADLLMRLDRIPSVDDVPVLERSFLLLLDEVDIHLHPAWQRKVLPFVQEMFPNAQIIATTHSPFVVASVRDARIITFALEGGVSTVASNAPAHEGVSYSAVLRDIFGITSEFDVNTEHDLAQLHAARGRLLAGDASARAEVDRLAAALAARSEELREIIAIETAQLQRQLARARP